MLNEVIQGDALQVLRELPTHSVDAICCDPPSGIFFMGKSWDSDKGGRDKWIDWLADIFSEALRVIKPGGHALVWALPKTSHWTALALEYGGWSIREKFYHLFGSGMPKSHNISVAIDRMNGSQREVIGVRSTYRPNSGPMQPKEGFQDRSNGMLTAPATPDAQKWEGWGTATKPAVEEWILARAPLSEPSIAANVLRWGTGGLNIDKCRVASEEDHYKAGLSSVRGSRQPGWDRPWKHDDEALERKVQEAEIRAVKANKLGRWPANLLLSHTLFCTPDACAEGCPVAVLDTQSGHRKSGDKAGKSYLSQDKNQSQRNTYGDFSTGAMVTCISDEGGASRYFQTFRETPDVPFLYTSKASRSERNAGCEALPIDDNTSHNMMASKWIIDNRHHNGGYPLSHSTPLQNNHPTVKPISLMRYLVSLVCPPGGIVLDMFAGSGTTGVACIESGFNYILIEQDSGYCEIARARLAYAIQNAYTCKDNMTT